MFRFIGTFVYRMRFLVIAVMIAMMAGLGLYGLDLGKHLSQSGWFDPTSESDLGSRYADQALGRDHTSDVILMVTPPEGTRVDDKAFGAKVETFVEDLIATHPDIVGRADPGLYDPFLDQPAQSALQERLFTEDGRHAFISIGVAGDDDTTVLNNYKIIEPFFDDIGERFDLPDTTFELAGLQPVSGSMAEGMDKDIHRAEVIALPIVAIMLFFVFGGVVAACLPVLIGGLTIAGSLGIMKILALTTELNIFAQSVVTLIGLGIAIDYGLFIVSRFREELGEGYSTKAAVRRTVMTAGQTVVFSATIIVAALACLLIMPQGFLKSVAYGAIASVSLAAILSITVLPAILGILGPRVNLLSISTLMKYTVIPLVRRFSTEERAMAIEDRFSGRMKTSQEVENGFWGRLATWVMKHPVKTAVPTVLLLLALIIPFGSIQFGGISEKFLPPDNPNRVAQEKFDEYFPSERTEAVKLVIVYDESSQEDQNKLDAIAKRADEIPGFTNKFSDPDKSDFGSYDPERYPNVGVYQVSAGLKDRNTAAKAIEQLRAIDTEGLTMYVAGTPALTQDSIDALMDRLPLMAVMLVLITGVLMFLQFGSIVLPIKAALMTALGLGATLGILTWIFVDGHGAEIANFTPGPLFAAILVLIIAIVFGLSTDYEVFLLSRMVEARQKGASTTEAIRSGTAHTGGIITAAAAILVVVTGAFSLSEIVMMKYIAYGMIAALILDATVIRMLLVPSVMKLLGDDCWWAPRWMRVVQRKIGLGEAVLDDEPDEQRDSGVGRPMSAGTLVAEAPTSVMVAARPRQMPAGATPARRRPPVTDTRQPGAQPQRPGGPVTQQPAPAQPVPPQSTPPQQRPHQPAPGRGNTPVGNRPQGPTPPRPARVGPAPSSGTPVPEPTADRRPVAPYRRPGLPKSDRPDTGGWSLGEGGIRLGDETSRPSAGDRPTPPATDTAPGRPASSPTPPRANPDAGQPSPLGRRPALDQTGRRPLAASVSPESTTPSFSRGRRTTGPSPMERGLSSNATPAAPSHSDDTGSSEESGTRKRPRTDRHARDDSGDDGQISVQELLKRSRSQK
ncbi:MMPL family transporter [Gordonia jinghuaiqii]|uniref:MMPL family transporter n=1 Tax=Gordonia jinghuaiqii TaxID=2758710 RepID=A0A7D7RAC6_9ACTN|nr:MMPL family transporter [Gordonia jinghuaiqii]MCR5978217.1 MMPL family transporter [Gordonia jinghuaiqii]QMT01330.1 MMPL family transporter [Gordonia jinghuaiqii]